MFRRREWPEAKTRTRVGKHTGDPDRAGRRVDFTIGERNPPGMFVDGSIAENQLKRHPLALRLDALFGGKATMELHEHLLADREVGLDGIDL
jgi:hypothetical protein